MPNPRCNNPLLLAIQNKQDEINQERNKRDRSVTTDVECRQDDNGEYLHITRYLNIELCDENGQRTDARIGIPLDLRVDMLRLKATYSGNIGLSISSGNDLEEMIDQMIRTNTIAIQTMGSLDWVILSDPNYTRRAVEKLDPIPLYAIARRDIDQQTFFSQFTDALADFDITLFNMWEQFRDC